MNTGIQDAGDLAGKIHLALRGHAADGLLESYSAERAPVGRDMVALSDRMGHTPVSDVSALVEQISEIGIHYRKSPIVSQDWHGDSGPQPGDRAPLVEGLNGSAHHLLLFTGEEPNMETLAAVHAGMPKGLVYPSLVTTRPVQWDAPVIVDEDRTLHEKFGARTSCVYLVRPDGYVGYRGSPEEPGRIAAYLRTVFR